MFSWLKKLMGWLGHSDAGVRGERLAAEYLQREHGFAIVTRNWRNPRDRREELDLVCRDGDVLVFVEVKTRSSAALVTGYHVVTRRKKRVLLRAGAAYLRQLRPPPRTFRFDIVEVTMPVDGGPPVISHFANIPLFPKFHGMGRM